MKFQLIGAKVSREKQIKVTHKGSGMKMASDLQPETSHSESEDSTTGPSKR